MICPLLSINFFRYQKISGKQKGSFTKLFVSVLWDKKFRQNLDAPLLCMKIFVERIFLKHQSVLQWNISIQWDKNSDGKSWSPPLSKLFRYPKLLQQESIPLQKFSALWDKKISIENLETPPPPLIHKLFRYRKISETQHRRVHLPTLSALWDKKFSTEKRDTP